MGVNSEILDEAKTCDQHQIVTKSTTVILKDAGVKILLIPYPLKRKLTEVRLNTLRLLLSQTMQQLTEVGISNDEIQVIQKSLLNLGYSGTDNPLLQ